MFKISKKTIFSVLSNFFKALKPSKKLLFSRNFIFPAIAVIGIITTAVIIIFSGQGISIRDFLNAKNSSPQKIGEKVLTYLNEKLLKGQATAALVSVGKENGLIKLRIKIGNNELNSYATTDGKFFFPQVYELDEKTTTGTSAGTAGSGGQQQKSCEEIKKATQPLLEAFVVSKCPFGLQMQRILAEVIKNIPSLAKNIKVEYLGSVSDGKITSMHGEAEAQENLRQLCIREEQNEKYWDYISCHIKKGDVENCLASVRINTTELNACMKDSSRGLKYAQADFDLQKKYGAGGSPTMILNGERGSEFWFGGRKAEAVKTLLCCGFKEKPSICSQKLSEKDAAASFSEKYEGSGTTSSGGGCQ